MRVKLSLTVAKYAAFSGLLAISLCRAGWADPIEVIDPNFFHELRMFQNGVPSSQVSTPDTILLSASVALAGTSTPPPGVTTMVATNSDTHESFDIPATFEPIFPLEFSTRIPYTDARANGSWTLEVENVSTTTDMVTVLPAQMGPGIIGTLPTPPLATNVEVYRSGDNMIATWALPDGVGNATRIRPRLHAPDGDILIQDPLPLTALSWSFPAILAGEPGQYGLRVQMEETGLSAPVYFRRSSTWQLFNGAESIGNGEFSEGLDGWSSGGNGSATVIEFPAGSGGMLLSLTVDDPTTDEPVVLSQLIDTPSTGMPGFVLRFDHLFLTETGILEVLLNDILLDTILATDSFGAADPVLNSVLVTDLALADLTDAVLEFRLFPGSEASVLLDSISVSPELAVPEPTTLLLMGLGLAGLGFTRRRLH